MTDLAVKVFMAENHMDNFDVAQTVMYKYGLAQPYEDFANRLQFLLTEEQGEAEEAFAEGVEFVQEVFKGIRFHLPPEAQGSDFVAGIELAMDTVDGVIQAAVDGARMTDKDVELEGRVRNATIFPLNAGDMSNIVRAFFDNRREPTSR